MKKNNQLILSAIILCITLFFSCSKEGPVGEAGQDGNANVVSSTITSSAWVYNDPYWEITFSYSAITQDIINNGAVLVYIVEGGRNYQLPITIYQSSSYSTSVGLDAFVGGITINWSDSDLTQPDNPGTTTFKIVVISADGLIQNPNLDVYNYNEVQKAFEL